MATNAQYTLGTVALAAALAAAGGFALGRFTSTQAPTVSVEAPSAPTAPVAETSPLPPGHPPPGAGNAQLPLGAATAKPGDHGPLSWTKPEAWQEIPNPNSMRIATYRIAAEGDGAEMAISKAGGSLDANIERWAEQFGEEGKKSLERESRQVNGVHVTVVRATGSSYTGMSGETKQGEPWQLLAAIVVDPNEGDQAYFFKLTGPKRSVEPARGDFEALLSSFQFR